MKSRLPYALALVGGALMMSCSAATEQDVDVVKPTALTQEHHAMINGSKDLTEAHRAVVSLYIKGSRYYGEQSICTGTLIHPQWVVTAAHCVTESSYSGKPVASSLNSYIKIGVGSTEFELANNLHEVEKIYFNENYGERQIGREYYTIDGDIALIKLQSPIEDIKPIPILPSWLGINRAAIKDGVTAEFVGFGYDENGDAGTKIAFSAPLTSYCGSADGDAKTGCEYGAVLVNGCHPDKTMCDSWSYYQYCKNGYFCLSNYEDYVWLPGGSIYYEQDNGGPCQGDSGGPAFIKIGGAEYVAGLTSYGDSACAKTGISTAVQDYTDWILGIAPEARETIVEVCGNGLDDDNNGLADCSDSACADSCSGIVDDPEIDDPEIPVVDDDVIVEDFSGIGSDVDDYEEGSFDSSRSGISWSFLGRTDIDDLGIDGEGLMIKDGGFLHGVIHGGIGSLSVEALGSFSFNRPRSIRILLNGVECASASISSGEVSLVSCDDVNISGDVDLRIEGSGAQIVLDNLKWSSFE